MEETGETDGKLKLGIKLPESTDIAFRNLKDAKVFAMDIGGSLTKIAYYSTVPCRKIVYNSEGVPQRDDHNIEVRDDTVFEVSEGARLHFVKFETKHIEMCLDYISNSIKVSNNGDFPRTIKVTGGGAFKYAEMIEQKVGLPIDKVDEHKCMVKGCDFLLSNISDEAFLYQRKGNPEYRFLTVKPAYPYMLVTIGSGVSMLKVTAPGTFERVGGTATGGGTFWGLGKLLTKAKGFDELLELAEKGDHRNIDMLVKDIYGERHDYGSLGLPPDLIASSIGKAINLSSSPHEFSDADVARSLLYMISNDIGQIASLYAMLHNIKSIYFGGFFLRHHPVSLHTINYSVNFFTKGEVQARFLRHEGYIGAIGAFLHAAEPCNPEEYSWTENLYGSSGFPSTPGTNGEIDQLEVDRFETRLGFCPLIKDPELYIADTVDLTQDPDAREYWLQCLQDSLPKFTDRAIHSQETRPDVHQRAEKFKEQFLRRLLNCERQPFAHGTLTVRSLLDLREHCLVEFDFHDPYMKQKQYENDQALALLPGILDELSTLDWEERQQRLVKGFLAGNVFDWGAKEVALMMENKALDFNDALRFVGPRPWLVDDVDRWVARLRGPPHRCATIFIDNSGVDVILGVLPFVQELLSRGTQVLLCANNRPVLNDVTFAELRLILQRASPHSPVLAECLANGQLECVDSGQSSPCLDLAKLNASLVNTIVERHVDLVIFEGMGRAIHTNLYASFTCECLKAAVLKNRWLANRLGGDMFAVIFKYETPDKTS